MSTATDLARELADRLVDDGLVRCEAIPEYDRLHRMIGLRRYETKVDGETVTAEPWAVGWAYEAWQKLARKGLAESAIFDLFDRGKQTVLDSCRDDSL